MCKRYGINNLLNSTRKIISHLRKLGANVIVSVNDVKVSDGEKGCERAVLLFKCNVENKDKVRVEHKLKYNEC